MPKSINEDEDDIDQKDGEYVELPEDDDVEKGAKGDKKGADDKRSKDSAKDDAADGKGADADDDADKDRLSVEGADERSRRREERHERRQRQKIARSRTQNELRDLRDRLDEANARIEQLSRHSTSVDAYNVDQQLRMAENAKVRAEAALAAAIKAGNAEIIASAMAQRDGAVDQMRRMTSVKERMRTAPRPEATPQRQEQIDPRVTRQFNSWMGRNDWFDPKADAGGRILDLDSRIAMSLDQDLESEGFDPTTPEYWEELEDRCRERMPHLYEDDGESKEREGVTRTVRRKDRDGRSNGQRKTPPVSAGSAGSNNQKGRAFVSSERVQALKDAGVWDDPKLRNKYIKSYRQWDKDHVEQR